MIKKLFALSISLAFSTAPAFVHAQGNIATGKIKSARCAGCHGKDGNSMMPSFPKLAGQHESYLTNQLLALKNGGRNAPMMAPMAMGLDDKAIEDISAYYASNKISSNPLPVLESNDDDDDDDDSTESNADQSAELDELMALGKNLYRNGNLETNVAACTACHSPTGTGNKAAAFPALRGQHADYLIQSLSDFKKGTRSNLSDKIMHMIAKKMTDEEIQAVSYHISMMK